MIHRQAKSASQRPEPAARAIIELRPCPPSYTTAWGTIDAPARRTQAAKPPGDATPCVSDRCFGRELIGWKSNLASCSTGIRVGIIDTDVDHEHPALLSGRLRKGTFIRSGTRPAPNWHGTGVLALMAGDARSGTPGLVPHAEFFVAEAFFVEEGGGVATDTFSVIGALDWMRAWDVQVINMSFAGPKDDLIQKRIAELSVNGVVLVAAAGNEGPTALPAYPAAYKQVIAVTAVNKEARNFALANRGSHIDLAAPGVDIWTAVPRAREGYYSGTSFAAPFVTAVMATLQAGSQRRDKESMLALLEFKDLGAQGRDSIYGRGVVVAPNNCRPGATTPSASAAPAGTPTPAAASWPASVSAGAGPWPSASSVKSGFR